MLTPRQSEILTFIQDFSKRQGYPPTIREIGRGVGIQSLRGVTVHLDALARKGYLQRSRQARGLKVLGKGQGARGKGQLHAPAVVVPLVGRIAAGKPILADGAVEDHVAVDERFVPAPGCFIVRVHGESMVEAGIRHGDFCVVRPTPTSENGDIVAVPLEGEATVKRFFREQGVIRLKPENRTMNPIELSDRGLARREIRLLGQVVGLLRKY